MSTLSPIAKLPRPELTDPPNVPTALINLTNALDPLVIPRFANSTARNIAIPSPTAGQHAYLTESNALTRYDSSVGDWVSYNTTSQTSSGLVVSAGFTLTGSTFLAKKINGVCSIYLYVPVISDITPSGQNITPDRKMCEIPAGYRPPDTIGISFDNGTVGGEGIINTDGSVYLRTVSGAIAAASGIRFSATFVQ